MGCRILPCHLFSEWDSFRRIQGLQVCLNLDCDAWTQCDGRFSTSVGPKTRPAILNTTPPCKFNLYASLSWAKAELAHSSAHDWHTQSHYKNASTFDRSCQSNLHSNSQDAIDWPDPVKVRYRFFRTQFATEHEHSTVTMYCIMMRLLKLMRKNDLKLRKWLPRRAAA